MTQFKYMLDTNICIYIMRNKPRTVLDKFKSLATGTICISAISYGELMYGLKKSNKNRMESNIATLLSFIDLIDVISLPVHAAEIYGQIKSDLSRKGTIIGENDLWIAAHALSQDLILVTNNEKEFCRVENLKVENWVA